MGPWSELIGVNSLRGHSGLVSNYHATERDSGDGRVLMTLPNVCNNADSSLASRVRNPACNEGT